MEKVEVGCGYCAHVSICKTVKRNMNNGDYIVDESKLDGFYTIDKEQMRACCHFLLHYAFWKDKIRISKTTKSELIKMLNEINNIFKDSDNSKRANMARRARILKNKLEKI